MENVNLKMENSKTPGPNSLLAKIGAIVFYAGSVLYLSFMLIFAETLRFFIGAVIILIVILTVPQVRFNIGNHMTTKSFLSYIIPILFIGAIVAILVSL